MNITHKVLSIPPYISTAWKNISSLQVEVRPFGAVLVIELLSGRKIEIPQLDQPIIEKIFAIHATVVEQEGHEKADASLMTMALPFPHLNSGFTTILQHNPEQKDTPPLPTEILEKVAAMAKNFLPEDTISQPEPDCHCPHCQIVGAIRGEELSQSPAIEEEVTDEDLKFRTWDIKQERDKLYSVINPFDQKEHYTVFLGEPIGCTCGDKNCDHIQAVLRS